MNDRARVPFALLGVVLLVGSTTYAGSLSGPGASEPRVAEAMEEFSAESRTAMMEAARDAAMRAAAEPVVSRASTPAGRALGPGIPFRDALRLRVYTRIRQAAEDLGRRQGRLRLSASLPVPETEAELRRAVKRVTVERAGPDGAELRVTVEDVRLTARRNGRTVARTEVSPTLRVAVPTLAVHDRVALFEQRLDAGPAEPGLGRRLTASLYPLAWTRGYAQYAGTPIENVVANRHVALATNGAVLDIQRSVFGANDPVGRRALREATVRTAISDALKGSGHTGLKRLKRARGYVVDPSPLPDQKRLGDRARARGPSPDENVTIGVNATAERAFLSTVGPEAEAPLEERVERHYRVDIRRRVNASVVSDRRTGPPVRPGENWTRVGSERETTTVLRERAAGPPELDGDWHVLAHHPLQVVKRVTEREVWSTPAGTRTTETRRVVRTHVTVLLTGNHAVDGTPGTVSPVHARGGPLDGPNLADITETARAQLLASEGGPEGLARRLVTGDLGLLQRRAAAMATETTVTGERPSGLEAWVYEDLADLRRRVTNISVTTSRGKVATFGVNPPAKLRERLRERRAELLDRPTEYDGVGDRARVAARAAYLDRVSRLLEDRAERRRDRATAVSEELSSEREGTLHGSYRGRMRRSTPDGLAVPMVVDARPSYLTTAAVDSRMLPSLPEGRSGHPLTVRNTNVASVPYADAVGGIVEMFSGPDRVSLRRAAQALRVSGASLAAVGNHPNETHEELSERVSDSADQLRGRLAFALRREGLGTESDRRSLVDNATTRWEHPAAAARAFGNGSAPAAVHRAAVRKWPALTGRERDTLRLRLDAAVRSGLETPGVRVGKPVVRDAADTARTVVEGELRRKADDLTREAAERVADRLEDKVLSTGTARQLGGEFLAKLPMGVPLAPAPGFWYATANFWDVDVRGAYAQFIVRVPRGAPDTPGGFRYVRDGGEARLDVDADGDRELLGRASRIQFATGTDIAVAVPAGPRGVADVDGQRTEASAGWPRPGWK